METLLNKYAINQLGYVTDDLEKFTRTHSEMFGSGPFVYMTPPPMEKVLFRGEEIDYAIDVAYGMYGDLQIEIIKSKGEKPSCYTEKGLGFNHVSIWVDDLDQAVADFKEAGFEIAMEMWSSQGLHVVYMDTVELLGHYVEMHNPQPFLIDMNKKMAADWDGSEPYRPIGR